MIYALVFLHTIFSASLVGGASLEVDSFVELVRAAERPDDP